MTRMHARRGTLLALLDGEVDEAAARDLRLHLDRCDVCRRRAARLHREREHVRQGLSFGEGEGMGEAARLPELGSRSGAGAGARRRPWTLSLPRAAVLVLFLGVTGAAAFPASPLHRWITRRWEALRAPSAPPPATPTGPKEEALPGPDAPSPPPAPSPAGATLPVPEGGSITLWIHGLRPGAEITVELVEGDRAGIFAGRGTRYRYGPDLLEVLDPPGDVRVELPRGSGEVWVGVESKVLLRQREGGPEVLMEGIRWEGDRLRYRHRPGSAPWP